MLRVLKNVAIYGLIVLVAALFVFPYLWMVLTAFKTGPDLIAVPPKIVFEPSLQNFRDLIDKFHVLPAIFNSVIVVLMATTLAVAFGTLAAYALARFRFRGRDAIALDILTIRMVPPIATAIPIYVIALQTGLFNTYWALALVNAVFNVPLVIWVLRVFIEEMPVSIEEAALVDGCSRWRVLWTITIPLVLPGLMAVTILTAIFVWNEFLFANILTGAETKTLPVVVALSIQPRGVAWGVAAAGGTLVSLPIVVLLILIQRYLVRGLTFGVVKA
jgi:multiple sugar transport system permease protein